MIRSEMLPFAATCLHSEIGRQGNRVALRMQGCTRLRSHPADGQLAQKLPTLPSEFFRHIGSISSGLHRIRALSFNVTKEPLPQCQAPNRSEWGKSCKPGHSTKRRKPCPSAADFYPNYLWHIHEDHRICVADQTASVPVCPGNQACECTRFEHQQDAQSSDHSAKMA
jgi:hypothetical protein